MGQEIRFKGQFPHCNTRSELNRLQNLTLEPSTLVAHPSLLALHLNIFGRPRPTSEAALPSLLITAIQEPTLLSSLVLISHDLESYELKNLEELVEREGAVIREGELLSVVLGEGEGKLKRFRWRVAMTEPVLQGIVKKGFTKFLVLPPTHSELEDGLEYEEVEGIEYEEMEEEEEEEEELIEFEEFDIDESFLTASVIPPPSRSQPSTPSFLASNALALINPSIQPTSTHHLSIEAHPLTQSVPSNVLIPRPEESEDEVPRVYLKMRDLGKLGMFSGDWVVVRSTNKSLVDSRLVRAFACDGIVVEEESLTFER